MGNIFKEISGIRGIIKDESVLKSDYLPENLIGRESQLREAAFRLKDAEYGRAPHPLLFIGKPGTGKTTAAKLLLKQLCEVSSKPIYSYINCWEFSSRYGILSKIIIDLNDMMPRRGVAPDELLARIYEILRNEKKVLILILDEIDRLIASKEESILYDLARAKESDGINISMIGITNVEDFSISLDQRIRSSLAANVIRFEPYNALELKNILKERAKKAFYPGTYNDDVIGWCASIAAKYGGDARFALYLLWASAKKAEEQEKKKIDIEDVSKVKEESLYYTKVPITRKIEYLDQIDKEIVGLIAKNKDGITTGEIYQKLNCSYNEQRTIRNRLERLVKENLIEYEDLTATQKGGRTRKWKIKNDLEK
jgi:cell division control protein 6